MKTWTQSEHPSLRRPLLVPTSGRAGEDLAILCTTQRHLDCHDEARCFRLATVQAGFHPRELFEKWTQPHHFETNPGKAK